MGIFFDKKCKQCGRLIDESQFSNWGRIYCSTGCKKKAELQEKQIALTMKQSELADRELKESAIKQREIERLRIENSNRKKLYEIINELRRYYSQATSVEECNALTNNNEFLEVLSSYTQFATDVGLHEEYHQLVLEFYEELNIRVS